MDFDHISRLADTVSGKLQNNNIYTIAKRNVEGQDMLYQSLKLTNGIWILAELRIQPGNPNYTVTYSQLSSKMLLFSRQQWFLIWIFCWMTDLRAHFLYLMLKWSEHWQGFTFASLFEHHLEDE